MLKSITSVFPSIIRVINVLKTPKHVSLTKLASSEVVLVCCCVKIRVPRTKQEIEADYCRKKLAEKFRVRLKLIQNQDMDALDLERALHIIQEDYINESRNCQLVPSAPTVFNISSDNMAQPQQPSKNSPQTAPVAKLTLQK
ncbi:uncharacterized protein isoform X2 [Leptinotarsa decemlineata]|uniref:uncharacterized protein isoform X2 n=1 Tax=Leptinotarsa decemlineata TaxID=7539 RepID=UPI003D308966